MRTTDCELLTVQDCLAGRRPVDDEVSHSAGALAARLETLQHVHPVFVGVRLSPYVEQLMQAGRLAVS